MRLYVLNDLCNEYFNFINLQAGGFVLPEFSYSSLEIKIT